MTMNEFEASPRSGAFELVVNNKLIWSKFASHTFPTADDVLKQLERYAADPSQFPDAPELTAGGGCVIA